METYICKAEEDGIITLLSNSWIDITRHHKKDSMFYEHILMLVPWVIAMAGD